MILRRPAFRSGGPGPATGHPRARSGPGTGLHTASATVGLVGGLVALRLLATGVLAPPPITDLGSIGDWADAREPIEVVFALLRQAAEVATVYLLVIVVLHVVAARSGHRVLVALTDVVTRPAVRRLFHVGFGITVAVSSSAPAALASAASAPTMAAPTTAPPARAATGPVAADLVDQDGARPITVDSTATIRPGDATTPTTPGEPTDATPTSPGEPTDDSASTATIRPAPAHPSTHSVDPGDSFWRIATDTLEAHLGRTPSVAEIDPYWRRLVDENRDRLVDPDNPDLVLPGQVLALPTVAG